MESYLEFTISGVEGKTIYAAFPTNYPRKVRVYINGEWYGYYLENTQNDGIIPLGKLSGSERDADDEAYQHKRRRQKRGLPEARAVLRV